MKTDLAQQITVTDKDLQIAKLKYVLDSVLDDVWTSVYDFMQHGDKQRLNDEINSLVDTIDGDESIDAYARNRNWLELVRSLNHVHDGDCVAFPATCMRCMIEGFMGIDTAPATKADGSKLMSEFNSR